MTAVHTPRRDVPDTATAVAAVTADGRMAVQEGTDPDVASATPQGPPLVCLGRNRQVRCRANMRLGMLTLATLAVLSPFCWGGGDVDPSPASETSGLAGPDFGDRWTPWRVIELGVLAAVAIAAAVMEYRREREAQEKARLKLLEIAQDLSSSKQSEKSRQSTPSAEKSVAESPSSGSSSE
jgi:hypothetical protein